MLSRAAPLALMLFLATPALAVDGVLEINQTCATQTGCFAGDSPGWPVTITVPGSYRLTSNLRRSISLGGSQSESFIDVQANDVSIDLGGFQISCATILGGSCGTGGGSGVTGGQTTIGTSLKNGSIAGMAGNGVSLRLQAEVRNVRVHDNRYGGILVSVGSMVSQSSAYNNGGDGISADSGSTVSGNSSYQNGEDGIYAGRGATVTDNATTSNGGYGLLLSPYASYRGNTITTSTLPVPLGTVSGGVNAGGNVCDGSPTCP